MKPDWTFDRPTEPGEYWLSIAPEKRGLLYDEPVYKITVRQGSHRAFHAGGLSSIPEDRLDGAQWAKRETPADPFARTEERT